MSPEERSRLAWLWSPKKDGSLRVFIRYRRLNVVNVWRFPLLHRMNVCFDSMSEAVSFSTPETNFWYWRVAIYRRDGEKTANPRKHGLSQIKELAVVLCNTSPFLKRHGYYIFKPTKLGALVLGWQNLLSEAVRVHMSRLCEGLELLRYRDFISITHLHSLPWILLM